MGLCTGIGGEELKKTIRNLSDGHISGPRFKFPGFEKMNDAAKSKGIFGIFRN